MPYDTDLYFIVDDLTEVHGVELVRQLALIGLDQVAGVFEGRAVQHLAGRGIPLATVAQVTAEALAPRVTSREAFVLDVRSAAEWTEGHIPSATHIPLGYLTDRIAEVPADRPVVVQCQAGTRSAIAASVLQRAGHANVQNLAGGFDSWQGAGLPIERS